MTQLEPTRRSEIGWDTCGVHGPEAETTRPSIDCRRSKPHCSGTATGVLDLTNAYVFGSTITPADFVSFSYMSSEVNFTITPASSPMKTVRRRLFRNTLDCRRASKELAAVLEQRAERSRVGSLRFRPPSEAKAAAIVGAEFLAEVAGEQPVCLTRQQAPRHLSPCAKDGPRFTVRAVGLGDTLRWAGQLQ